MTVRAAIALVGAALGLAAPGTAAAPAPNPVDGVLIGDVFLQHDEQPTATLTLVSADCNPDGISTVRFHGSGTAAWHGDPAAGTFAVDATATIGPQRLPNLAEDNLDAGRLLSFAATVTLDLGGAPVVTTETLWEPGARAGQPLPAQAFLRHNYGFCNNVEGMDVGRGSNATGRVVGIEAESRNVVGPAEGRAELYLWHGAFSSVESGPLLDTRVAGIFGPEMAPFSFPDGTQLQVAKPRVVDDGTANPAVAVAATVRDAAGALQDGASLRFAYGGATLPTLCVSSSGGCWSVLSQPVDAPRAHRRLAVALDLNANGLVDPGEPVRVVRYVTPPTTRIHVRGSLRLADGRTLPIDLRAGLFRGRAAGTLVLGSGAHPLLRSRAFDTGRVGGATVVLSVAGKAPVVTVAFHGRRAAISIRAHGHVLRGRLVSGRATLLR